MQRPPISSAQFAKMLLATVVAVALTAGVAAAQSTPEFFEIAAAEHDPSGRVIASIAVPDNVTLEASRLTAELDGVPQTVSEVTRRDPEPLSVVITIDVSGSMDGSPLEAAREAALSLVGRLSPTDRVAVVAFATSPLVLSDFTTDRAVTVSMLQSLTAGGSTALYGAVGVSVALLTTADTSQIVFVMLSDGVEEGGLSNIGREDSLAAITGTGAAVFSFALGLDADIEYLRALADASPGGDFLAVADEQALEALFASLGRRLGADVAITVSAPPLAIGQHELSLRFRAQGSVIESTQSFEVTNAGLIVAVVVQADQDSDQIVVQLQSLIPLTALSVQASAGGEPLPLSAGTGRILIDPWSRAPGPLEVEARALVRGQLAAETSVTVEVPSLAPLLTLQRDSDGQLVASGRAQGVTDTVLRVLVGGEEVAQSSERTIRAPLPSEGDVEVRLEDAQGGLLRSESFSFAVPTAAPTPAAASEATEGGSSVSILVIAGGAAAVILVIVVIILLRRRAPAATPLAAQAPSVLSQRPPDSARVLGGRGKISVRSPDGAEQEIVMGMKPITIGSWEQCDIVLEDDAIRPVHVRISALGDGQFRLHGLAAPSLRPYATNIARPDEWMLVQAGDEVTLGGHVIEFHSDTPAAPPRTGLSADAAAAPPAVAAADVDPPADGTTAPGAQAEQPQIEPAPEPEEPSSPQSEHPAGGVPPPPS